MSSVNRMLYIQLIQKLFNSKSDYDKALVAAYDLLQSSYVNVILGNALIIR
jgi:hypothetical protein